MHQGLGGRALVRQPLGQRLVGPNTGVSQMLVGRPSPLHIMYSIRLPVANLSGSSILKKFLCDHTTVVTISNNPCYVH